MSCTTGYDSRRQPRPGNEDQIRPGPTANQHSNTAARLHVPVIRTVPTNQSCQSGIPIESIDSVYRPSLQTHELVLFARVRLPMTSNIVRALPRRLLRITASLLIRQPELHLAPVVPSCPCSDGCARANASNSGGPTRYGAHNAHNSGRSDI